MNNIIKFLIFLFFVVTEAKICEQIENVRDISEVPVTHIPKICVGSFLIKLKNSPFSLENMEHAYNVCASHADCAYIIFQDDDEVHMHKGGCKKFGTMHSYEMKCHHASVDEIL